MSANYQVIELMNAPIQNRILVEAWAGLEFTAYVTIPKLRTAFIWTVDALASDLDIPKQLMAYALGGPWSAKVSKKLLQALVDEAATLTNADLKIEYLYSNMQGLDILDMTPFPDWHSVSNFANTLTAATSPEFPYYANHMLANSLWIPEITEHHMFNHMVGAFDNECEFAKTLIDIQHPALTKFIPSINLQSFFDMELKSKYVAINGIYYKKRELIWFS